jgi:hypothetical protein
MNKSKKIIFSIFLGLFVLIIFLSKCIFYCDSGECLDEFKTSLQNKDLKSFDFDNELNCFDWDEMMFIPRDFDASYFERNSDISINGYRLMGIKYFFNSDYYTYLIFLQNKNIVKVVETSTIIDFDELITELNNNDLAVIDKKDAKFILYDTDTYLKKTGRKLKGLKFKNSALIDKYRPSGNVNGTD